MKSEKLLDAIGMVGEDLITDAKAPKKKHMNWKHWVAIAACLALLVTMFKISNSINMQHQLSFSPTAAYINGPSLVTETEFFACKAWPQFHFTVRAKKVLHDTFHYYGDTFCRPLRLIEMEVIRSHNSDNAIDGFYLLLSEEYFVDLTKYDALILVGLDQIAANNSVLYNSTCGKAQVMEKPLFATTSSFNGGSGIIAITDNVFDESLWTINDLWAKDTEYDRENIGIGIVDYGWSVEQIEDAIKGNYMQQCHIDMVSDITNPIARITLYKITSTKHGLYVPWEQNFNGMLYRRFINGYPTNESIYFLPKATNYTYYHELYKNGFIRSGNKFSAYDQQQAPSLTETVNELTQKLKDGTITPPHILRYDEMELHCHSIFGWYFKSNGRVYGVIRIDFVYREEVQVNNSIQNKLRYDDIYYIVTGDTNAYRIIDRDELLKLQGTADFIFARGYDENGKKQQTLFS